MNSFFDYKTVELTEKNGLPALKILDQTLLPNKVEYLELNTPESIFDAIYKLRVRGAPAIGVAAGYAVYVLTAIEADRLEKETGAETSPELMTFLDETADYLISARPTAVNLEWAVKRVVKAAKAAEKDFNFKAVTGGITEHGVGLNLRVVRALKEEAAAIHTEDIEMCRKIGENGLELLKPGMGILTHCNAGALATSGIGTALAPIYCGHEKGYDFKVYADETRPLLQGARLTSWEMSRAGVDVTLICDNMASTVMKQGKIQAVITGADRIAANGDAANKIGTSGVAILAKEYGIPFYVAAPSSTIDESCESGVDIVIEERPGEEIYKAWYEKPMAPEGVKTFNPAFDVTDHKYIAGIITEKGIWRP